MQNRHAHDGLEACLKGALQSAYDIYVDVEENPSLTLDVEGKEATITLKKEMAFLCRQLLVYWETPKNPIDIEAVLISIGKLKQMAKTLLHLLTQQADHFSYTQKVASRYETVHAWAF